MGDRTSELFWSWKHTTFKLVPLFSRSGRMALFEAFGTRFGLVSNRLGTSQRSNNRRLWIVIESSAKCFYVSSYFDRWFNNSPSRSSRERCLAWHGFFAGATIGYGVPHSFPGNF